MSRNVPDIFWIVCDEWRYDALGCAGHPIVRTPNVDRLAAQGVHFGNALCQTPTCVASRASFLSGWYSHHTGNLWFDDTDPGVPYFVDILREQGWCTLNIGKEHHRRQPSPFEHNYLRSPIWDADDPRDQFRAEGTPQELGPRFAHLEKELGVIRRRDGDRAPEQPKQLIIAGTNPLPADQAEAGAIVRTGIRWLGDYTRAAPLLCRLSIVSPHTPVLPPKPFDTMYGPEQCTFPSDAQKDVSLPRYVREDLWRWEGTQNMRADEILHARAAYFGLCTYVDQQIGHFLDYLEANWERPYVVLLNADHGNLIGEHGLHEKFSMYRPAVQVPFFLAGAGIPARPTIRKFVEQVDIAPTLLSIAGLLESYPHPLDGRDLLPLIEDPDLAWRDAAFSEMARDGRTLKYVQTERYAFHTRATWHEGQGTDPDGALYDLAADPHEMVNLFDDPQYANVREELTERLRQWDRQ
jgi:uncharacterized sulfatase